MAPDRHAFVRLTTLFLGFIQLVTSSSPQQNEQHEEVEWSGWGGNTYNNWWASSNTDISSQTVSSLTAHCNLSFPIGVSATPTVSGKTVFPIWDVFHASTQRWSISVTALIRNYAPISPFQAQNVRPVSRTSPQVHGDVVFFGTLTHALVVAVDKSSGAVLVVGSSSVEENVTLLPGYQCCSFVGNIMALFFDPVKNKFKVARNVNTISERRKREGWAGSAVWGSQPSVDGKRRLVFVGTGNAYAASNATVQCQLATMPPEVPYTLNNNTCLPDHVWQDSILAIELDSGRVKWVQQQYGVDIFTAACGYPGFGPQDPVLCPGVPGPDYDF
ncbi:hypothetical protein B0T16DRAFT_393125 [Cercophora newfieldiana]|uniref:Membrane-associated protein n=1 Tax=Cercophora newfieldiana TaxID=92897 RepID=A0AA39XX71_9PEZI|nr:hypothetical protein B0T16DRAFT_393125 [Cercophora newfieldiana]